MASMSWCSELLIEVASSHCVHFIIVDVGFVRVSDLG